MSKKFGNIGSHEQLRILSQLDEEKNPRLLAVDDYDRYAKHLTLSLKTINLI